jgi:hypothetical protein
VVAAAVVVGASVVVGAEVDVVVGEVVVEEVELVDELVEVDEVDGVTSGMCRMRPTRSVPVHDDGRVDDWTPGQLARCRSSTGTPAAEASDCHVFPASTM